MPDHIHIFGASGTGTTTLGVALSEQLKCQFLDVDGVYWKQTDPPFTEKNTPTERLLLLDDHLDHQRDWVVSGSLCGWGDSLIPQMTTVVFLEAPTSLRSQRILVRESRRFGSRIERGGDMHIQHHEFIEWAESYDAGDMSTRSLLRHENWIASLGCPLTRLSSIEPLDKLTHRVLTGIGKRLA